jgi:hypothetical protein
VQLRILNEAGLRAAVSTLPSNKYCFIFEHDGERQLRQFFGLGKEVMASSMLGRLYTLIDSTRNGYAYYPLV